MIVTISGVPGSGKTTVAKRVARELGWKLVAIGQMIRALAEKEGLSLRELMDDKTQFDKVQETVERSLESLQGSDNLVVDGRDAFFHLPDSLKIFLTVDERVAAIRVFNAKRKTEHQSSLTETLKGLRERKKSDQKRYKKMHNIDYLDKKNYDVVIDTSEKNVDEVVAMVIATVPLK